MAPAARLVIGPHHCIMKTAARRCDTVRAHRRTGEKDGLEQAYIRSAQLQASRSTLNDWIRQNERSRQSNPATCLLALSISYGIVNTCSRWLPRSQNWSGGSIRRSRVLCSSDSYYPTSSPIVPGPEGPAGGEVGILDSYARRRGAVPSRLMRPPS